MDMPTMIKRQATCITMHHSAILIEGNVGVGKSSLALRLLYQGAHLISDDVTLLDKSNGQLVAVLPERGRGCLEVRSLGILSGFSIGESAPVRLRIVLTSEYPERLPQLRKEMVDTILVPTFYLWANHPALLEQVLTALNIVNGNLKSISTLTEKD
jgi:serine kinase of HPr protein (carbohydrate metabolism regulator)